MREIKIIFEKPRREQDKRTEFRKKWEQKARNMLAWGVITLSGLGGLFKIAQLEKYKPEDKYEPRTILFNVAEDKKLTFNEKIELKRKIDYLNQQFGEKVISWLSEDADINKGSDSGSVNIEGFEKTNISNEDLKKIWNEKCYPEGWIDEAVSKIEFVNREEEMPAAYGIKTLKLAHCDVAKKRAKIVFFRTAAPPEDNKKIADLINTLDWYFSHEISHANDWDTEENLDFKNRVEFLYEITESCFRENAYRDTRSYIESIKNTDPGLERYCKATEYWAEICSVYFTSPESFKEFYPKEFELVNKYVKKEDPKYDVFKRRHDVLPLINQLVQEKKNKG